MPLDASAGAGPLVWLLVGPKAGDNAQLRTLGDALAQRRPGLRIHEIPLAFRGHELLLHLRGRPTLAGLRPASREAIHAPWPDLILTAGRRNELVALWIRARSGGHCRVVHLGRPWSSPQRFDLVISTPQYALPAGDRLLVVALPLHRLDPAALAKAAAVWRDRLAPLPRPWTALLLGGDSGEVVFTPALADRLAREIDACVDATGGTLLLTTSPRTPAAFLRRLREAIEVPCYARPWSAEPGENPYLAFLALADRLVVTAESVSMITEALASGKPVLLADVASPGSRPWWLLPSSFRWKPLTHRLAMALAPVRFSRDVSRIHAALVAAGQAAWLGEKVGEKLGEKLGEKPHPQGRLGLTVPAPGDGLDAAVSRVLALIDG